MSNLLDVNSNIDQSSLDAADKAAEAAAAAQRAGQPPGQDLKPAVDPFRENALDDAFSQVQAESAAGDQPAQPDDKGEKPAPEPTDAPAKPDDKPADPPPAGDKDKGLIDDLLKGEQPAAPAPTPDPYDEVKLRADASPKTRETFDNLKKVAREREQAAEQRFAETTQQLETLRKELDELRQKSTELTPEVKQELEELRALRARVDTENDPSFKAKYDTRLSANYEAIYQRLTGHGLPATTLDQLKALPAHERDAAIDGYLAKLPPDSRRFIEAKLFDNTNVADERSRALQEARQKAGELQAQRQQAETQSAQQREQELVGALRPVLESMPFVHEKQVPANATAEQKAAIEADNKFALQMRQLIHRGLTDDSPATRAQLAAAVPLAHHLKAQLAKVEARAKAAEDKLAAIERAGQTSRAARTIASPNRTQQPAAPAKPVDSGDALDALMAEALASKT